jgi:hypothetical protein
MTSRIRTFVSIILLLIVAGCVYLSLAAKEAPREQWWASWTIYAIVGFSCLIGAVWLHWPRRARP